LSEALLDPSGYRVIARKDGERVRLWARTTFDYSNAFARAMPALPVP
jgi:ATP-dependent DNA ligase